MLSARTERFAGFTGSSLQMSIFSAAGDVIVPYLNVGPVNSVVKLIRGEPWIKVSCRTIINESAVRGPDCFCLGCQRKGTCGPEEQFTFHNLIFHLLDLLRGRHQCDLDIVL